MYTKLQKWNALLRRILSTGTGQDQRHNLDAHHITVMSQFLHHIPVKDMSSIVCICVCLIYV